MSEAKGVGSAGERSKRERERLEVMEELDGRRLSLPAAARRLGVCPRQLRRIRARWRADGAAGLADGRRGNGGNRSRAEDRARFLAWYGSLDARGRYAPTHAAERFESECGVRISGETARQWLTEAEHWEVKSRRPPRLHPPRERRPRRGELVQVDASDHEWIPGVRCTLMEFVDDATSEVLYARFERSESTLSYLRGLESYMVEHGIPIALYSDRHSALSCREREDGVHPETEVGRVLRELGVEHRLSRTPQSRGRVERAHRVAQSRLLPELANHVSFEGLDFDASLAAANLHLVDWLVRRNRQFAVAPAKPEDAHIALGLGATERRYLFSRQSERRLSKDLCYSFCGSTYALSGLPAGVSMSSSRRPSVLVHERADGEVFTTVSGVEVAHRLVCAGRAPARAVESDELNGAVDAAVARRKRQVPAPGHPWRNSGWRCPQGSASSQG